MPRRLRKSSKSASRLKKRVVFLRASARFVLSHYIFSRIPRGKKCDEFTVVVKGVGLVLVFKLHVLFQRF